MGPRFLVRRILLLLGLASFIWTILLLVFGGVSIPIGSGRISSRNVLHPLIVAVLCSGAALALTSRDERRRPGVATVRMLSGLPQVFAGAAVVFALLTAIVWGTFSAGGADSYGYASQADMWARGRVMVQQPFVRDFPWPFVDWTFSPLGYRPGVERATLVPTYAAGLPLVMALFQIIGGRAAVFLVVPLAAAVTVWLTYRLGRRFGGEWAGALAAILLATSPTFAFQATWLMSDVPATMWWTAAVALAVSDARRPVLTAVLSGLAIAMALLTRPNLVLVALPIGGFFLWSAWRDGRTRRLFAFLAGALPGPAAIAVLHTIWYGSPLKSGYGSLEEIYAGSHAPLNLAHHPIAFVAYEQPIAAVAIVAILALVAQAQRFSAASGGARLKPRATSDRMTIVTLVTLILAVGLSYLFYVPYPEWYLRFFLPAYPAICCLIASAATRPVSNSPPVGRVIAVAALIIVAAIWGVGQTRAVGTHTMNAAESRYRDVGIFIARALPPNAIFLSVQESGSIRYYSGRLTLRFDWLERRWLEEAIGLLRQQGFHPYIALEQDERDQFRERFRGFSPLAELDWPPAAERRQAVRVQIYDPADRERYRKGMRIQTALIPPAR